MPRDTAAPWQTQSQQWPGDGKTRLKTRAFESRPFFVDNWKEAEPNVELLMGAEVEIPSPPLPPGTPQVNHLFARNERVH